MAITKCRILGAAGEPVHRSDDSVAPVWPAPPTDGPRWLEWRKIMSTNEEQQRTTSMPAAATAQRELTTADLGGVNGGMPQLDLGLHYTTPAMREAQLPWNWQVMAIWNELRRQNGI
jgi:hypothetical protein